MELTYVIYFYVIAVIVTCIVGVQCKIKFNSSMMIALILGQILMNILKPPQDVDNEYRNIDSSTTFYTAIQLLTPIIVYIYAIYMSVNNIV